MRVPPLTGETLMAMEAQAFRAMRAEKKDVHITTKQLVGLLEEVREHRMRCKPLT